MCLPLLMSLKLPAIHRSFGNGLECFVTVVKDKYIFSKVMEVNSHFGSLGGIHMDQYFGWSFLAIIP